MSPSAPSEFRVSLLVTSDSKSPEEITAVLGLKPTRFDRKGDRIGLHGTRTFSTNIWGVASPAETMQHTAEQEITSPTYS
jgi:hypothetical protein